jgi:hypothetical protein
VRNLGLFAFLMAGVLVITVFGAIRDSHRRSVYRDALKLYAVALDSLNRLVPDAKPPGRVSHIISYEDVTQARDSLDVWDWANRTALAARRVALGASRVAAAATDLKQESAEAADMRVDAEVLAANAVSLGRNFDEAFSVATLDSSTEVLATSLATKSTTKPDPTGKSGVQSKGSGGDVIPPKTAARRLRFFVAQGRVQKNIATHLRDEGQTFSLDVAVSPKFLSFIGGAFLGDLASSVWRTLFISAAVALIVLACATPAAYLIKRVNGTPGELKAFQGIELATVAVAAIPLLATPFLVASLASGGSGDGPSRRGPDDGGLGGSRSSLSRASSILTNNYADMRTDGSASSLAPLLASLEQQRTEDAHTRDSVFRSLRTGQRNVEVLASQLRQTVQGLTTSVTSSEKATRDLIAIERQTASRDRTIMLGSLAKADTVISQTMVSLDAFTRAMTDDSRNLRPQMNTVMAVAWMDECLRLREGKRAAPVRAFRWLIGSSEKTDLLSKMVRADVDNPNPIAKSVCETGI